MEARLFSIDKLVRAAGVLAIVATTLLGAENKVTRAAPLNPWPYRVGFPKELPGTNIWESSVVLADLYGTGRKTIVAASVDGWVSAVSDNGTILWSFNIGNPINAIAPTASAVTVRSSPAVADIDGDGHPEIVLGFGTNSDQRQNGGVIALTFDGLLKTGWPQLTFDHIGPDGYTDGVYSTPALGDLDNDGKLEIVVGGFDHRVWVWHHDGQRMRGWPRFVYDSVWSSPALVDLEGDGYLEVVVGADSHANSYFGTVDGGALYAFRNDGTVLPGFPKYIDQIIQSSPAVADLDGDGRVEMVAGTGTFYPGKGNYVTVWDNAGNVRWTRATDGPVFASPAVGDIDGDGRPDIVAGSQTATGGSVYAWRSDGSLVAGFPMTPKDNIGGTAGINSPALADFDNDGKAEIFLGFRWEVAVIRGNGQQITNDGSPNSNPTFRTDRTVLNVPAIGDIDNDGKLELVVGSAATNPSPPFDARAARLYVWNLNQPLRYNPWPMFKRDGARTSVLPLGTTDNSEVAAHTVPNIVSPGQSVEVSLTLRNTGPSTWTGSSGYRLGVPGNLPSILSQPIQFGSTDAVAPGGLKTFSTTIVAPSTPGYYLVLWRMMNDSGGYFGRTFATRVKVGAEPSFYVLSGDLFGLGVYKGGLASPLLPAHSHDGFRFYNWQAAAYATLTPNRRGYFMLDYTGAVWWGGAAADVGSTPAFNPASGKEIAVMSDGEGYYVIDGYGRINNGGDAQPISPAPPTFSSDVVRSLALTRDDRGLYVLDGAGNIYRGGTAPAIAGATTPVWPGQDLAIKIRLTSDGRGYYVLDRYGGLHAGGTAVPLSPAAGYWPGQDRARDFQLTEDGTGYYLLDKYGNVFGGGTAAAVSNKTPTWTTDVGRALQLADGRRPGGLPADLYRVDLPPQGFYQTSLPVQLKN
ncbi:MAG: VCBS repeat-containing protein [Chloroflexi bacterium]|nr:VCBS repeat-containing protein [Chloroflexota bacterium]